MSTRRAHPVSVKALTRGPDHHFFGYYDKCPWSADGNHFLTMTVPFMDHFPQKEPAEIGLLDLRQGSGYRPLAETMAWNWQQGAMLQWLPPDLGRYIIYNAFAGDDLTAVIRDIKTGCGRNLPRPIAALDPSGTKALSLNFGRLFETRKAYGYYGATDPWSAELHPGDDGIYTMDLATGQCRLIVPLERIAAFDPTTTRHGVKHWVNHLAFNPGGTRFCFLHRWQIPEIDHFGTRLFTANADGGDIRCLWAGQVSHFDWRDNEHLLAWVMPQGSARKTSRVRAAGMRILKRNDLLRKTLKKIPLVRRHLIGGRFMLFDDGETNNPAPRAIGEGILTEDGHCSYSPDREWILMDLYPNISNGRRLLVYNIRSRRRIDIGSFYSPRQLRDETRCDLHARWSRDGTQVCIDSAHEGTRQMYVLDVTAVLDRATRE